jgi:hypothetical protein
VYSALSLTVLYGSEPDVLCSVTINKMHAETSQGGIGEAWSSVRVCACGGVVVVGLAVRAVSRELTRILETLLNRLVRHSCHCPCIHLLIHLAEVELGVYSAQCSFILSFTV